jgi:hypothetical protein
MAIPASHIVLVYPRVITPGSSDLEMNGLLFSKSALIPADKVLSFPSARTVSDYFGPDSDEYAASLVYFQAYDNKFTAPRALLFARRVVGDVPGRVNGAALTVGLSDLTAVTSGTLVVSVGNDSATLTGLNFSSAPSLSAVAAILQAAMETAELDATVGYSSVGKGFFVTSTASGEGTDVSFEDDSSSPAVDLARRLGLRTDVGAVLSPGMNAMGFDEQMTLVTDQTQNWVAFSTVYPPPELAQIMEMAAWASRNYGYLYVPWDMTPSMLDQTSSNDMASLLKDQERDHVAAVYGGLRHAVFIMGSVASVPWLRINGTITFAFKHQTGLEATVSSEAKAVILESKNCNYHGNFATRNADFRFLYPGVLSFSSYKFIDS